MRAKVVRACVHERVKTPKTNMATGDGTVETLWADEVFGTDKAFASDGAFGSDGALGTEVEDGRNRPDGLETYEFLSVSRISFS